MSYGDKPSPWGNGSSGGGWKGGSGGGQGGGGNQPPDIDQILKSFSKHFRGMLPPGGFASFGGGILLLVLLVGWLLTGLYKVDPDEQGVVMRFGRYVNTTDPGLHYHLPYPIETVLTPQVTKIHEMQVGYDAIPSMRQVTRKLDESLMLTGDENIVDVRFAVYWRIKDAGHYLFNVDRPESTIKSVAESVMREVIGRLQIEPILTTGRQNIEEEVKVAMQKAVDSYKMGIDITQIAFREADPPAQVIEAFRDVQAARADKERVINEANAYKNKVVPESRGQAEKLRQEAEAYRKRVVDAATGEAERFLKVYQEYSKAEEVTKKRIYLETVEKLLAERPKLILEDGIKDKVLPYLPLSEMNPVGSKSTTRNVGTTR